MFIVVVGAGRTGGRVIELATRDGHEVVAIEKDHDTATDASTAYDALIINDDGASRGTLIEADIESADALVATTDDDATNLLVMMHGRDFDLDPLVSSVNDVANIRLYQQLGVHVVENPHRLNGEFLYRAVQRPAVQDFMSIGKGAEIFEITVAEGAPIAGRTLQEAADAGVLPEESLVVALLRDDEVMIPRGKITITAGDVVTVFSLTGATADVVRAFVAAPSR